MIRGCQREMIVLQTRESPLFENAYLVLRRGKRAAPATDMMAEASRIIGEGDGYLRRRRRFSFVLFFGGGALFGAALVLLAHGLFKF